MKITFFGSSILDSNMFRCLANAIIQVFIICESICICDQTLSTVSTPTKVIVWAIVLITYLLLNILLPSISLEITFITFDS